MKPGERLQSLDALRGFDMFFIMGFAGLVVAVCSLFPGGKDCWLAVQMGHASWDGFQHHDTIFPLFLYLAGVSFPFSLAKQRANGSTMKQVTLKIIRRCLTLILLGFIYSGLLRFDFEHLRVFSVLARIGLASMIASLLYLVTKPSVRAAVCVAILIGYCFLLTIPAPDVVGADPLSRDGNIIGYVDRTLFGENHLYYGNFDPEGLLSALPAVVTAFLGMFTGDLVRIPNEKISGNRKTLYMLGAAVAMLGIGFIFNAFQPCNKALWNSAFVMFAGCYSVGMFAIFYWIIDVRGHRKWTMPLTVVGMNSITIYLAQKIINFSFTNKFFLSGVVSLVPEQWGKVIYAAGYVLLCWLFLYFLYKKKIFLKV